jgi:hypothetical protein
MPLVLTATFALLGGVLKAEETDGATDMPRNFVHPPNSARPWVYWFPLDGNITSNGITADLEAMKRVGIGGVLYMETDQGAPRGPAHFGGPLWRALFQHICSEANRLCLEVNMNNDAGWCGSGGPWITPELSMQHIVWTETNVAGGQSLDVILAQPKSFKGFYRDIAVFAFPTRSNHYVIPQLNDKSSDTPGQVKLQADYPELPAEAVVSRKQIVDLTARLKDGRLQWDAPAGTWTILRMGHTSTGVDNHPAPIDGRGLESDKLSKEASEAAFAGLMTKVIDDSPALSGKGRTLVRTHIDSWETGAQNWTPKFREDFQRLRGYDPLPLLPVMTGQVVDSLEVSERFLWDVRMTVNDLLLKNYAGHFREMAHRRGLTLSIEAYDGEPAEDMAYGGQADEPMAEFWSWPKFGAQHSCTEMSSAAHIYGKPILGAEAFTAGDGEKWQGHPALIKDLGDWAFCEGINRFVFHRYALQPWTNPNRPPGMSMGPWGLHYERTQTWWEQSKAWHEYLARCQYLLRQGRFVADLCFLEPENSPQRFKSPVKSGNDRPGYNFDGCTAEVVLDRMSVHNGQLVLPGGASYRCLVLPEVETMSPQLLQKIKKLAAAGAMIVGNPPRKSPSLSGYPECDQKVVALAKDMWGSGNPPEKLSERAFGKGRIVWGAELQGKPGMDIQLANWIWYPEGNPAEDAPPGKRYLRRAFDLEAGSAVTEARMVMTADNSFECWINGRRAGSGDDWSRFYSMDVTSLIKSGANLVAVAAVNGADVPNPAGLIGFLCITFADGHKQCVSTDGQWQAALEAGGDWTTDAVAPAAWKPAMVLGPMGMAPWGQPNQSSDPIPNIDILCRLMNKMGVPPDFSCQTEKSKDSFRYTHRTMAGLDIYFVANKTETAEDAVCSFRVQGCRPELWWPDTGVIEPVAAYEESDGCTRIPVSLGPKGSVFVLFRAECMAGKDRITSVKRNGAPVFDLSQAGGAAAVSGLKILRDSGETAQVETEQAGHYTMQTAAGKETGFEVGAMPAVLPVAGPWTLTFPTNSGAPERVSMEKLISWSDHPDAGVKFFSGTATYACEIPVAGDLLAANRRWYLDLGNVAVMAEVKLNGKDLGILWKAPFRVEVTGALKTGENDLEIKVVNLWINRLIGDEQLPEDSLRNGNGTLKEWPDWLERGLPSPTGRITFTSWRLWHKHDALVKSGLLGPVTLQPTTTVAVNTK